MTNNREKCFSYIDSHQKDVIEYLQSLIQIPTQAVPGENYDKIAKFIENKLEKLGCETIIYDATEEYLEKSGKEILGLEGPRSNLVATYKGGDGPTLLLNAHTDTVPVDPMGWSVDPFSGVIKNDRVYGRGACDDKGEISAMVHALEAIVESGINLNGNVIITATPDEEIGGIAGLGYLINERLVKADYGIGIDGNFGNLMIATNGRVRWKVNTRGYAVHSSRAHTGINAIEKMSKIVLAIADYRKNVLLTRQEDIPVSPESKMDKLSAMINVGSIEGGLAPNIVPDFCSTIIDRRTVYTENLEDVINEFQSLVDEVEAKDPEVKAEVNMINFREGTYIEPDHPWVKEVQKIYEGVTNSDVPIWGAAGSADMCYQINQGGWPTVGLGAGDKESHGHGIDESVKIDEVINLTKVVSSIIIEKLGK
jgi:succinyl-diaminopimelate desuccinylase